MSNWIINLKNCGDYEHSATIKSDKIAIAEDSLNKDLLGVKFILCHEGVNLNLDGFYGEELQKSYASIVNKPINWEHSKENIGTITTAYLLDPSKLREYLDQVEKLGIAELAIGETRKFVLCEGVIWKDKHPERAMQMLDSFSKGQLFFSMENWFDYAQCSVCGSKFSGLPYCEHLTNRHKTGQAVRYFLDFIFTGAGKVGRPGDPGARGVSFASKVDYKTFLSELDEKDLFLNTKDREGFANLVENQLYSYSDCPCESLDNVPTETDAEKMLWLFVCKDKNRELFDKAISSLVGDNEMSGKTYTEEEVQKLVNESVSKAVADHIKSGEQDSKFKEILEKNKELANLNKELTEKIESNKTETDKIAKALEEKEKFITDMKEEKRKDEEFASRISVLETEGIPFDKEKIKKLIYGMSEDSFVSCKESLSLAAKTKKEEKKEEMKEEKKSDKGKANEEDSKEQHEKINEEDDNKSKANEEEDEVKTTFKAIFGLASPLK